MIILSGREIPVAGTMTAMVTIAVTRGAAMHAMQEFIRMIILAITRAGIVPPDTTTIGTIIPPTATGPSGLTITVAGMSATTRTTMRAAPRYLTIAETTGPRTVAITGRIVPTPIAAGTSVTTPITRSEACQYLTSGRQTKAGPRFQPLARHGKTIADLVLKCPVVRETMRDGRPSRRPV
jgi:hypothetical protein